MDRGYLDFERLHVLHQAGAFFVTRAKSNLDARRVYSAPTDRTTGIICDQTIALNGYYSQQHYPDQLRRIRLKNPESARTLVFLSNQFALPAATICALYKARWQSLPPRRRGLNCSSNGSSSTFASSGFTAPRRTQ